MITAQSEAITQEKWDILQQKTKENTSLADELAESKKRFEEIEQ